MFLIASRILFFLLLGYVTWGSITTGPVEPDSGMALMRWIATIIFQSPDYADKVTHFAAYGALGFSGLMAQLVAPARNWIVAIFLSVYGVFMEAMQFLGGERHADALDALANMSGVAAGMAGFSVVAFAVNRFLKTTQTS